MRLRFMCLVLRHREQEISKIGSRNIADKEVPNLISLNKSISANLLFNTICERGKSIMRVKHGGD